MQRTKVHLKKEFDVLLGNRRSQAAEMTLRAGDKEGDQGNRHRGADQWLYVVSGNGTAIVNGVPHRLSAKTLLLIERGEKHEIRQRGRAPLRTVNIYVPPAYSAANEPLPRGRR